MIKFVRKNIVGLVFHKNYTPGACHIYLIFAAISQSATQEMVWEVKRDRTHRLPSDGNKVSFSHLFDLNV